jgi:[ribosomal protein S5]-alanine N-acetyltransferase
MKAYPEFKTERLTLREIVEADTNFLFSNLSNSRVLQYFGMSPLNSKKEANKLIESFSNGLKNGGPMRWAIVNKEQDEIIGTCGFHNISKGHHRCEIGYDLSPTYWGKGIMTEALVPLISYLFKERDMIRIGAVIVQHNAASAKVVEKLGFKQEGLLRKYITQEDNVYDAHMYSLLREEWDK